MLPLELYLITFNCAREFVDPHALAPHFFDAWRGGRNLPDIIAVSLQEVAPIANSFLGSSHIEPYLRRILTAVDVAAASYSHDGQSVSQKYRAVQWHAIGMMAVVVLVKEDMVDEIVNIQTAGTGVGFYSMGNKGAAAIRLYMKGDGTEEPVSLTFVAAHLYPHETGVKQRNDDWKNLVRSLIFENKTNTSSLDRGGASRNPNAESAPLLSDNSSFHTSQMFTPSGHLFFFGDLNYRTSDSKASPDAHLTYPIATAELTESRHYSNLLPQDQLNREKKAGRTLHGLAEQEIDFAPTYKYEQVDKSEASASSRVDAAPDQQVWRFAKHRFPSWCDRILFTPDPNLTPRTYMALPLQPSSDHRPVALAVTIAGPRGGGAGAMDAGAPFPINRDWRAEREAARRREIVVGVGAWVALTRSGNLAAALAVAVGLVTWWFARA